MGEKLPPDSHLMAEIFFIFSIVYLTGSSSECPKPLFLKTNFVGEDPEKIKMVTGVF